jgi:NAD(P)-dependent dehydrogenase (short-subunit alcohol dehydrogenase family)
VHWATVDQPRLAAAQQRQLIEARIARHPDAAAVQAAFDAAVCAGFEAVVRGLARRHGRDKIRVNAVVPNKIGSPVGKDEFDPTRPVLNLVGRPGVPEDLARAALFLVSDDSEFIVGTALFVDGGCTTLMPGNA